mgnify:CR=1 FL=1
MHFGSSPLARGLRDNKTNVDRAIGIIPARAGFTGCSIYAMTAGKDHPRSRGVYRLSLRLRVETKGSSPLARGLLYRPFQEGGRVRIIPARAGFTSTPQASERDCPDHPRSRGVYSARPLRAEALLRIIPARAGFTNRPPPAGPCGWDHPRSRGVYVIE